MRPLVAQLLIEIQRLPNAEQDALAELLLEELLSRAEQEVQPADAPDDPWATMVKSVEADIAKGSRAFPDIFKPE